MTARRGGGPRRLISGANYKISFPLQLVSTVSLFYNAGLLGGKGRQIAIKATARPRSCHNKAAIKCPSSFLQRCSGGGGGGVGGDVGAGDPRQQDFAGIKMT